MKKVEAHPELEKGTVAKTASGEETFSNVLGMSASNQQWRCFKLNQKKKINPQLGGPEQSTWEGKKL